MTIAIYDTSTGNVVRWISDPVAGWVPAHDVFDGEAFLHVPGEVDLSGKRIVGGAIIDAPAAPDDMVPRIAQAVHTINRYAARDRGASEAKDTLHAAKADEARAWVAAGRPDAPDDYPLLAGGAEGAGRTFESEASAVLDHASRAAQTARNIERRRAMAKTAARAATTPADIDAAIDLYRSTL